MIKSFRSRALRRFWTRNDATGIRPDWQPRVGSFLNRIDNAQRPQDLNTPGSGFHALIGDQGGRYALTASRNWRLTFGFDGADAIELDLEDYHG